MIRCERAPSVSGEHPTAHSGEGRRGGAGVLVGPVAPSRACYVFCGCCADRVEGCGTPIAGPVAPMLVRKSGLEISCKFHSPNHDFMKYPSQPYCDPMHDNMTSHHRSPHPTDLRRRDPVVGTISVDAGLHAACAPFMDSVHITRCCVFACCAAHPRSDQSQVVCPDLPHGDVRLCRRRRLPSLRHPETLHATTSTNALWSSSSSSSVVLGAC